MTICVDKRSLINFKGNEVNICGLQKKYPPTIPSILSYYKCPRNLGIIRQNERRLPLPKEIFTQVTIPMTFYLFNFCLRFPRVSPLMETYVSVNDNERSSLDRNEPKYSCANNLES